MSIIVAGKEVAGVSVVREEIYFQVSIDSSLPHTNVWDLHSCLTVHRFTQRGHAKQVPFA
jgi:hypothetical protein